MKQLFLKELNKLAHAWSVRIVFLLFMAGAVYLAVSSDVTGYMAPFMGYELGTTGVMLFIAIVAGQVAGEYKNGRVLEADAVGRGKYFAAKVMGLFGLFLLFCLIYEAVFCLACCVKNGMGGGGYFSYYPLQVGVFLLCRVLLYWVYIAVFILIGVLVRRKLWTVVCSVGAFFLEAFLLAEPVKLGRAALTGPFFALTRYGKYIGMADFLSYDFLLLIVPGLYAGVFALILGYFVFRRGRLQLAGKRSAQGLAAISVLFLLWGQTGSCAGTIVVYDGNRQPIENVGELRLVYGDSDLDDGDAFVLLLAAEGFTKKEQEKFFTSAGQLAAAIMKISPYDEFADVTKIYALGTISAESGIVGDKAENPEQAKEDSRDTFFGVFAWKDGHDWELGISREGFGKLYYLRRQLLPSANFCGVIANYGTRRGTVYLNSSVGNYFISAPYAGTVVHELSHAVGRLGDEYDKENYTIAYEAPNVTRESDPEKVKWARYISADSLDDISVYEFRFDRKGWYYPGKSCIMRNSDTGSFCRVCEDALRESIGKCLKETRLLFAGYGERVLEAKTGVDMRQYFTLQKTSSILDGSLIPEELLRLTYYDRDGEAIDGPPGKAGTYSVAAEFIGGKIEGSAYAPCELEVSYEIRPNPAGVFWLSVAPLLTGTAVCGVWLKVRRKGQKDSAKTDADGADVKPETGE